MEGSPFCPNCNVRCKEEEKITLSVNNKGVLSGDVLLSEKGKTVISKDNRSGDNQMNYDKPSKEYTQKNYSLRKEDVERAKNAANAKADFTYLDNVDPMELNEWKNDNTEIPKWKIKQEEKKRRKSITSAHHIGTVQGGKILPAGLSPEEFMKLPDMSRIRTPYFCGLLLCYAWMILSLIISVLFYPGFYVQIIFIGIVLALTFFVQFLRSKVASVMLIVGGLVYFALSVWFLGSFSGVTVTAAGLILLLSTVRFEKVYKNYLQTQTIPDDVRVLFK